MKELLLLIACITLIGCDKTVNDVIAVSASFYPQYSLIDVVDISTNDAKMLRVRITLPRQLSETEIIENFRSLVIDNLK